MKQHVVFLSSIVVRLHNYERKKPIMDPKLRPIRQQIGPTNGPNLNSVMEIEAKAHVCVRETGPIYHEPISLDRLVSVFHYISIYQLAAKNPSFVSSYQVLIHVLSN